MTFDTDDLDPPEAALLALEYLQYTATWMEESADADVVGDETARVLTDAATSIRTLHGDLDVRLREHYGDALPQDAARPVRLRRKPSLVPYEEAEVEPEENSADLIEVACAEQEETYHFFVEEAERVQDAWLQELLRDVARHARGLLLYLEGERESVADRDGRA